MRADHRRAFPLSFFLYKLSSPGFSWVVSGRFPAAQDGSQRETWSCKKKWEGTGTGCWAHETSPDRPLHHQSQEPAPGVALWAHSPETIAQIAHELLPSALAHLSNEQFESFFFVGVPRVHAWGYVVTPSRSVKNRLEISSFRRVTVPSSRPLRSSSNVPRQKSTKPRIFGRRGTRKGGSRDSCLGGRSNVKRSPSTAYEARESSLRKPHTAEANSQA